MTDNVFLITGKTTQYKHYIDTYAMKCTHNSNFWTSMYALTTLKYMHRHINENVCIASTPD